MKSFAPVFRGLALAVLLPVVLPAVRADDVVLQWNAAMTHYNETQPPPGTPPLELRAYAMAHIAMFHAIERATNSHADASAAGARAAHDVLVLLLPGGTADFNALLMQQLAAVPDGPDKITGQSMGVEAATTELVERAKDGAAAGEGPYKPGGKPGNYQFTPPFDQMAPPGQKPPYAHFPLLGKVVPFVLKSADQFRAPPPYAVTDAEYAFEFNEVKLLGAQNSTARTPDQTDMARFWYEMSAFSWNRMARILAASRNDSLLEHARLFAVLNAAMTDSLIAGFDSKYFHNFWRPITAIHAADNDGNPATAPDPAWAPLMLTPPMPDYISTHSAQAGAAAVVLTWFFQGDEQTFTLPTTMTAAFPDLKPRTFHRISDAATETALSRVFAGIHFRFACVEGLKQGRAIGAWAVAHPPFASGR